MDPVLLSLYRPPLLLYIAAFSMIVGCGVIAKRLLSQIFRVRVSKPPAPGVWFLVLGFMVPLSLYASAHMLWLAAALNILCVVAVLLALGAILAKLSASFSVWTDRQRLAFVSGVLAFYGLLRLRQALHGQIASLVDGIGESISLVWVYHHMNVDQPETAWLSGE